MKTTTKNFLRNVLFLMIGMALLRGAPNASARKLTYDLHNDWSNTQNPNGAWSYNYNTNPISTFQTFWWGQAGWGDNWIGDGCIIKGSYFEAQTDPWGNLILPAHDWRKRDVMMHAVSIPYGGDSKFLNVTWTSPADGKIDISGRAWDGEIFSDRDVAWLLIVDGTVVAQRTSTIGIYRNDAEAQFGSNLLADKSLKDIPVTRGSVVEFRVVTQTYYGHFVGVNLRIKLTMPRASSGRPTSGVTRGPQPESPQPQSSTGVSTSRLNDLPTIEFPWLIKTEQPDR